MHQVPETDESAKSGCGKPEEGIRNKKNHPGSLLYQYGARSSTLAPSSVSATENQQNHQTDTSNLKNFNPDSATKAIFVLNELINIFNSMGGLDNMYNALSSTKNPTDKLASVLSIVKPLNVN
ncbi:hypothetical protein CDAR_298651 [Caerostris darwini]|uniref:Uncharacterized protein n=1 Tax=Caerostris darwini TaxID=1538125 RepID=A0AAV4MUL8_9ARAC|nr:hypothetical protein CDAR_298651 [Caerostris darwini]